MDSKAMPYGKHPYKVRPKIMEALASAVHEWFLIFMLFIEACFSYLVTKFARNCHLETPCLLCSRLDHVLGKERSNFYLDLICHKHKLQMSSLVLCHYHSNLVDVHEMCENCLFSFAAVNKSNAETYRLLVGKMGAGPQIGLDGNSKTCSCCHEESDPRAYAPKMSQTKSSESQGSELKLHLPLFVNSGVNEHRISRDETYRAGKVSPSSISNFNPLPHVEYEKAKLTSDSESETPMSEDEAASFILEYRKKFLAGPGVGISSDDPVHEKFVHPARESEPSHMESEVKHEVTDTKLTGDAVSILDHGSEGMSTIVEHRNDAFATPELISFADSPLAPHDIGDVHPARESEPSHMESKVKHEVSNTKLTGDAVAILDHGSEGMSSIVEQRNNAFATPELISFADSPLAPRDIGDVVDLHKETLEVWEKADVETEYLKESAENCEVASLSISQSTSEEQSHSEGDIGGRCLQMPDSLELGDSPRKLAVNSMRRQLSGKLFEQRSLSGKLLQLRSLSFKESPRWREEAEVEIEELKESAWNCEIANPSISLSTSEEQSHSEGEIGGRCLQMPNSLELGDAYNLAVKSRRRPLSNILFEQRSLSSKLLQQRSLSFKESPRGGEDFQVLLSQLSLARGIDLPLADMSPSFPGKLGALTASDSSTSAETQVPQRGISLERNESNISLEGSSVNEIEGESEIDRLKRQVDHDKKLMYALYKDLEEERNASAIAANEAMAMITRLQEEKAALNMEALQCLRMMDEQVEYDEEGLETARNLLTEKDEVVQDLEHKLQLYTHKYGPLSIEEEMVESFTSSHLEELGADDINACHVQSSTGEFVNPESNQKDTFDSQASGSRDSQ